ncbi:hypothetical protein ICM05_09860 [Leucobacter sp. cx-42]|uniref:Gp19/Gp15/Gp42 family protein n=1 Tax=unclassified Leucobacter TaxID=2621730 RepID=UPI00165DF81A|nr:MULTISPECIES: Gp19/Gp15/Gp42 family protein [unclassified Leucobacter]MBC9954942.1 hypothetical protein [Leucobacter sp. cx-42]
MAFNAFADVADVEAAWGELTIAEEARVRSWLESASTNLRLVGRDRRVDIDALISGNELLAEAAKDTVVASVRRRLMNPRGLRQRSRTVGTGPASESEAETIDSSISAGGLYFEPGELIWLPKPRKRRFKVLRAKSGYYA